MADEDRDQDRIRRGGAARPVTAAARRERRASSAREDSVPQGRAGRVEDRAPAQRSDAKRTTSATKPRQRRPADATGKTTVSKQDQGVATRKRGGREKRPSVVARFIRFVREVVGELRKVIWPTRKQQVTYTVVVLVFLAVVVAIVSGLDLLFAKGVFWLFA